MLLLSFQTFRRTQLPTGNVIVFCSPEGLCIGIDNYDKYSISYNTVNPIFTTLRHSLTHYAMAPLLCHSSMQLYNSLIITIAQLTVECIY